MKEVILYTTHCTKCNILKQKLDELNIRYLIIDDIKTMIGMGMMSAPFLGVGDEKFNFTEALRWIENNKESTND